MDPLEIQHPKIENSRLGFIETVPVYDATSLTPPNPEGTLLSSHESCESSSPNVPE